MPRTDPAAKAMILDANDRLSRGHTAAATSKQNVDGVDHGARL
jgi:hypothetical protein